MTTIIKASLVAMIAVSTADAATIIIRPIRASGVQGVDWWFGPGEREVSLLRGDQQVMFEGYIREFAPQEVSSYDSLIACTSYVSSHGDLAPPIHEWCPNVGEFETDFCYGIDVNRPDFLLANAPYILATPDTCCSHHCPDTGMYDMEFQAVAVTGGTSGPDTGIDYYMLTFSLDVSAGASGTFDVTWEDDPYDIILFTPDAKFIYATEVLDAKIRMVDGSCCISNSCFEFDSISACDELGGAFHPDALCGDDIDDDGTSDLCDLCPGEDDLADADGDTIPDACDPCPLIDNSEHPDCQQVPAVDTWGLIVLTLCMLIIAKLESVVLRA